MKRLLVMFAVTLAAVAASAPTALAAGDCTTGGTKFDSPSGSEVVDGVTITWSGTTISATGGTAFVCVKAGDSNSGLQEISDGNPYTVDFENNGGQFPNISHIFVISASTTPPAPPPTPPTPPPGGGAGGTPPSPLAPPAPPAAGSAGGGAALPFTGVPVLIPLLLGAGLLGTGLVLLRRGKGQES